MTLNLMQEKRSLILKRLTLPVVVLLLANITSMSLLSSLPVVSFAIEIVTWLFLNAIIFSNSHRIALLTPEEVNQTHPLRFTKTEWKLLGWIVATTLAYWGASILVGLVIMPLALPFYEVETGFIPTIIRLASLVLLIFPIMYFCRISLVFPMSAIGGQPTMPFALGISRGYNWKMFTLVALIPFSPYYASAFLPQNSFILTLMLEFIGSIFIVFGIFQLSVIFRLLIPKNASGAFYIKRLKLQQ